MGITGPGRTPAHPWAQMKDQGMVNNDANFRGYTFRQLLLAMGAVALVVRVVLSAVPGPDHRDVAESATDANPVTQSDAQAATSSDDLSAEGQVADDSIIEVMPFNLHGHVPAPLLASILRQHRPELTDQHAGDLMDTLPPGASHRMIVILPEPKAPADKTF